MVQKQKNKHSDIANDSTLQLANQGISTKNKIHKVPSKEEKLFLQLLYNYPDGIVSLIDKQYNFIYTGGELHKRLAANPAELIGNKIYPKFPENVRRVIQSQLEKVFAGGRISAFELHDLIKSEFYIMDAFPLMDNDDEIAYAGVVIRDISHLKKAEEELKISLKKERELSELKSRFITMASHEFSTPLTTILSSVQLFKSYTKLNSHEKLDKHIERIVAAVNHLTDILNDFLRVGNMQEGNISCSPVLFNIKDYIAVIIAEFENEENRGQLISYKHSGKELVVLDPLLLKHIATNVLSNAIKFSTKKTTIEIKTRWINGRLVFSVKDHGIGIPPEYSKHLFEPFYRASNAMNIQGTGLGLHLVSKYVKLMNGTLHYTSELEKGTEFVIDFLQSKD